jgi:hypothetical protein
MVQSPSLFVPATKHVKAEGGSRDQQVPHAPKAQKTPRANGTHPPRFVFCTECVEGAFYEGSRLR